MACPAKAKRTMSVDASMAFIEATSKGCPSCGFATSHFLGHACHHISPDTNGCPQCHTHYCYACLSTAAMNTAARGDRQRCACPSHFWSEFCSTNDIAANIVLEPYPHDKRCGCQVCPFCRPGSPCEQCPGSCPVCKNEVAPGPSELVSGADAAKALAPAKLATFVCVAEGGLELRRRPQEDDGDSAPTGGAWESHCPMKDDLVTGEVVEGVGGGGKWLKVFVRGIGDVFLPTKDPLTGAPALEPFRRTPSSDGSSSDGGGSNVLEEGDPVRIRPVAEADAERAMEGHGGWVGGMEAHLGTYAHVFEVRGHLPASDCG
jgi:hypothetical protein